ncbi:DUF3320 domain-containing protein [uncultured Victivallis sp.]|uniref:DUF3320 domain-containing protein n=1 Tax=uncultured Victivallis sp. TaxID=354118 RepID=UPI0025E4BDA2|nr:DUF3320 domain-containing protein [uncultured Victivallis sp.]
MDTAQNPAPDRTFSAELEYLSLFNLALQQNAFPVVSGLNLHNSTGRDLTDLECSFSSIPLLIRPKSIHVDSLKAGEKLALHELGIELDYTRLAPLTEAVRGKLRLEIRSGEELLFTRDYDVTAFAPDQWLGSQFMPELLASFVTPNQEEIQIVLGAVAEELRKATGSSAIEGYQADKTRVYEICSAIFRALHARGIRYSNPPASFGVAGQRIRLADAVLHFRLGTCLDTAILFASVMEQCELHPVILLQKGHAYVGCHLVDRYFADLPMDDLQTIRKLVDLDEFLVIETTAVTKDATFSEAEAEARASHLNIDGDFQCAIDISRARLSNIRPLPLLRSINGIEITPAKPEVKEPGPEQKRRLREEIDLSAMENSSGRFDRVTRWTQKLLDLSLRNRLLNVRDTRQVIPIICPDITLLEDKIAADETLSLGALSGVLSEKDQHDLAMLRSSGVPSTLKQLLEKELSQQRLFALLPPGELQKRLTGLYRQSRTDLEEGGVNTLFLAVGFLEWKSSERDERSWLAPILLIPIRLERRSMTEGIRIARIDEDTIINETLLELLRTQFKLTIPGLSPLPTDDSGVDVNLVMQIFRQSLREMKGWEVREEAKIGRFSFDKFIMWNDMTTRIDILRKNPLVNHLIEGGGIFDDGIDVFPPEEIASHLNPLELYCPMSADSSQLAAVLYSQTGKSFVLHGPPGTGKSQTITNIIAHNLALGRRVLFVSEKKAALDVVHRRLSSIGLRPFCLELHSSKAGKSEVLAQFAEALNVPECPVSGEWAKSAGDLEALRGELNEYVRELHKHYPNGFSARDCFARRLGEEKSLPDGLVELDCLTQTREEFERSRQLAVDLAGALREISPDTLTALRPLKNADWNPRFERELLDSARTLLDAVRTLKRCFDAQAAELDLTGIDSVEQFYRTALLSEQLATCGNIPAKFFTKEFISRMEFLRELAETGSRGRELAAKLANYRLERLVELDFPGIAARLEANTRSFFLFRFFRNHALLKELAPIRKLGSARLTATELAWDLPDLESCAACQSELDAARPEAESLLGELWNGGNPDWNRLTALLDRTRKILDEAEHVTTSGSAEEDRLLWKLQVILPQAEKLFADGTEARNRIHALLTAWNDFQEKLHLFARFAPEMELEKSISSLNSVIETLLARAGEIRAVMRCRKLHESAAARGLSVFAAALESGKIPLADAGEAFESALLNEMLNQILAGSPVLCNFTGSEREERIRRFCELDKKYTELSKNAVFARLAAALPRRRSGPCPEGTELGILKRECEKRARLKPVRLLLEQIPTLAPVLKPCFLMSPLSVAQYLPPDAEMFDLIVFDEASQIPVWDAIGVIARGKQLIVVGDPKQMPPTNFFRKGESDEDEEESPDEIGDLESILDECIAAGVYSSYLNWHYRSRHESLISFSNHYYYDDRLFTFPAVRSSERLGVRFRFIPDGVYDRKATRTNRKEAEALVKYVFERLENPGPRRRSIGVVTFSQAQKDLIEDLIEQERARRPHLESWFNERSDEPLFVKNLENVQGDERDVILFSICYAEDAGGGFSMNFGPLNRQGGERRLNVAITRAREQVVVFSSIHASRIDLSRTSAVGAAHLKYFLDYAEKGFRIAPKSGSGSAVEQLADTIAGFLTSHGYPVERNVGRSGCRFDLAVRHPERPSDFLLGIECDGEEYAAQRTTRDRDHLRTSVLHSLGWHIYRAWSVEWVFNRTRSEEKLLALLEKLRTEPESAPAPEKPSEPPPEQGAQPATPESPSEPVAPPPPRKEYRPWVNAEPLRAEFFYDPVSRRKIRAQMLEVVQQEGPVYESVLKKRIVRAWGFNRTGENIQSVLNACLPETLEHSRYGGNRVFWPEGVAAESYREYRVPADENSRRAIDEIPPEELANAMHEILTDFGSCERDTLYRETLRLFGLSTVTNKARRFLEIAEKVLVQTGRV